MKLYKSLKLCKDNIYANRFTVFVTIVIFTLCILLQSLVGMKKYDLDIEIVHECLSQYDQCIYVIIVVSVVLRILSFEENYAYILRVGMKDKVWNLIIQNMLITSFIISVYLVMLSYICGVLFSNQNYMEFNKTIILIIGLICIYTIGISLFSMIIVVISEITRSKNIAYLLLISIIAIEYMKDCNSLILYHISFNMEYLNNIVLLYLNILKFGGILILLIELGRVIYKRKEIYNTKRRITNGV